MTLIDELSELLGDDLLVTEDDRRRYGSDTWSRAAIERRDGHAPIPLAVATAHHSSPRTVFWPAYSEASCRANTKSTSGRSTASSTSGTGLFSSAPYTIADDTKTTWSAARRSAVPSVAAANSVALSRLVARRS